jgi:hypothetical protein
LSGRSIPENAANLYETVLNWVTQYIKTPKRNTNFRLNLEYFNTASSIWIAKIVKVLSSIQGADKSLIIHLYFNIEEFDNMDPDDLKDLLSPVIDMIGDAPVNISIKIYGTDDEGKILKESMVLI